MKISEVKTYLNRPVWFVSEKLNINKQYLLTACILRQNDKGEYFYTAEITDIDQRMSVVIVKLDEIYGG